MKWQVEQIAVRNDADRPRVRDVRPHPVQQRPREGLEKLEIRGPFRVDRIDLLRRHLVDEPERRRSDRRAVDLLTFNDRFVAIGRTTNAAI